MQNANDISHEKYKPKLLLCVNFCRHADDDEYDVEKSTWYMGNFYMVDSKYSKR